MSNCATQFEKMVDNFLFKKVQKSEALKPYSKNLRTRKMDGWHLKSTYCKPEKSQTMRQDTLGEIL